ncbi:hypothetical protein M2347_003443 [Chryseobacterium sp. H1D6B]|uniref:hypothetical protein n=1 Tax=Chryseobacterium sp. H1D6B TaxID=2940588 RepID=UPI0015C8062C|nr:hypothetical protein [Chryseobacterium sp. H1D6B]MDH6253716.1 hypothetical protein [Chryseobacterium sp. H1D6B]
MNPEETNKSKVPEIQQDQDPENPSLLSKAQQLEKDKEDIQNPQPINQERMGVDFVK